MADIEWGFQRFHGKAEIVVDTGRSNEERTENSVDAPYANQNTYTLRNICPLL
jgi:hypothetical protein